MLRDLEKRDGSDMVGIVRSLQGVGAAMLVWRWTLPSAMGLELVYSLYGGLPVAVAGVTAALGGRFLSAPIRFGVDSTLRDAALVEG